MTGKKLSEYLKENIFKPAGMDDSYLENGLLSAPSKAKGYTNVNGELKEEIMFNPSQYWAAGGVVSTRNDLIKWDKAVMMNTILPQKEISQMMQPPKLNDGSFGEYGLGFELMNTPTMKVAGNNGVGLGYNASNLIFLNDGLSVIVLTNTSNSNSSLIAKTIRDIIAHETVDHDGADKIQRRKDKVDTLVMQIFDEAANSNVNTANFSDTAAVIKFKSEAAKYIQLQGKLLDIRLQGEKINPQTIVRRYEIEFEKGKTMWVIIFSHNGKMMLANHM